MSAPEVSVADFPVKLAWPASCPAPTVLVSWVYLGEPATASTSAPAVPAPTTTSTTTTTSKTTKTTETTSRSSRTTTSGATTKDIKHDQGAAHDQDIEHDQDVVHHQDIEHDHQDFSARGQHVDKFVHRRGGRQPVRSDDHDPVPNHYIERPLRTWRRGRVPKHELTPNDGFPHVDPAHHGDDLRDDNDRRPDHHDLDHGAHYYYHHDALDGAAEHYYDHNPLDGPADHDDHVGNHDHRAEHHHHDFW